MSHTCSSLHDSPAIRRLRASDVLCAGESWRRTLPSRPWTILIALLAIVLHVFEMNFSWLVLSRDNIARGALWTLLTGPLLHASTIHVTMDVLGLLVVGWIFEPLLGKCWPWLVVLINVVVGLTVLAIYPEIDAYCGLSALVQGLLAAGAVVLAWRGDRLPAAIIGGALIAKWTFEIVGGLPLMSTLSSDPLQYGYSVPMVHAIGGVAGTACSLMVCAIARPRPRKD